MSQQKLLEAIGNLGKLSNDISFRNAFIANPKTIIKEEFRDITLSDDINIHIHENSSSEMHVILMPEEAMVFNDQVEDEVEKVLDKAIQDTSFKKLLMADPKGTLATELPNFYTPEDFKIHFYENSATEIHLLIPSLETESDELSESELDAVAGGKKRGPHVGRKRGGGGPRCRRRRR